MILLLAVLDDNLLKYDTLQENLFKANSQQAVYHFHAQYLVSVPLESLKQSPAEDNAKRKS